MPVVNAKELTASEKFTLPALAKAYLAIPLQTPAGYSANDASVGDLDGDGVAEARRVQGGPDVPLDHLGGGTPRIGRGDRDDRRIAGGCEFHRQPGQREHEGS